MNAPQIHLLLVHVPVIGVPFTLVLLLFSQFRRDEFLFKLSCGFLLICLLAGIGAYFSGPPSMELLDQQYDVAKEPMEQHAVMGKTAFTALVFQGALILNIGVQYLRGETPPRWLRWLLVALVCITCYLLAWSAHLGGHIRHPEIRESLNWLFPPLPEL